MSLPLTRSNAVSNVPETFSRAEGKALMAATNREVANGIVMNTRQSVTAFITSTAMNHTANLARQAYALADGDEYLGNRLRALVDSYVAFAHSEITSLDRIG